jgi:hypothetical protein
MGTVIPEFGSLNPAYACAEDYRIVVAGSHSDRRKDAAHAS